MYLGRPQFIITQKDTSNITLDKIIQFLSVGKVWTQKNKVSYLKILDIKSLYNIFLPLFNKLHFFTIKGLDFFHWSYLVNFYYNGLHSRDDVKHSINCILQSMNFYRLSTNIIKHNLIHINLNYNKLNKLL